MCLAEIVWIWLDLTAIFLSSSFGSLSHHTYPIIPYTLSPTNS